MQIKTTKKLLLHSDQASHKSADGASLSWGLPSTILNQNAIARFCSLHSCEFAHTFFNIPYSKTIVVFDVLYTIVPGNYNVSNFIAYVKAIGFPLLIVIDKTNLRFTFSTVNGTNFTLSGTMMPMLGFSTPSASSMNAKLTSTFPVNFAGISRLDIFSSSLKTINYSSRVGIVSALATIGLGSSQCGDMVQFVDSTNTELIMTNVSLGEIDLLICDETGTLVDFQGQPFSCVVHIMEIIEVVPRAQDFEQFQKTFVSPGKEKNPLNNSINNVK